MPLGTITKQVAKDGQTLTPRFRDHVQFVGDNLYVANGSTGFAALVAAALDKVGVDIVGVSKAGPCGGYEPIYDKASDALMLFQYPGDLGPATEVPDGDYSTVTLDLWVEYI